MQTLNILESQTQTPIFNIFNNLRAEAIEYRTQKTSLIQQLQTTLDLNELLKIFAMEASRYINFSGLYFKNQSVSVALQGSKKSKNERQFELKLNKDFIGTLSYEADKPISMRNYQNLERIHQILLYPLKNALQYHQAMKLAMQDGLTGLGNRRYFDEQLKRAMHYANRQKTKVGLVLGDLNKFKAVNDTFGHNVGDQVLKEFSSVLRTCIRDYDSVFRFGGDEFAIIVESASEHSLNIVKKRINDALKSNILLAKYLVSCSLGATFMNRADNESTLFERADNALYRQKLNISKNLSVV